MLCKQASCIYLKHRLSICWQSSKQLNHVGLGFSHALCPCSSPACTQGEDFPVSLPLVGGVPLTCSPGLARNDYDLLPVAFGNGPQPSLILGGSSNTSSSNTSVVYAKVTGVTSPPPGFRAVTCAEAKQAQQAILPYVGYLEICSVVGGTVRGSRDGFDNAPSNTVLCPDPNPPTSFSCMILAVAAALPPPSPPPHSPSPPPPPRPSPPLPPGSSPAPPSNVYVLKLDINAPVPDGFRAMTCAETQQYQVIHCPDHTDLCREGSPLQPRAEREEKRATPLGVS